MAERNLMMFYKGLPITFSGEDDLKSRMGCFFDMNGYPKSSMRKYRVYGRIGWEGQLAINNKRFHFNCRDMEEAERLSKTYS